MRERLLKTTTEALVESSKYNRWVSESDEAPRRRINLAIREVHKQLKEIESLIDNSMKLREDNGLGQDVFYKPTMRYFTKISERMLRIGNKLREFNK